MKRVAPVAVDGAVGLGVVGYLIAHASLEHERAAVLQFGVELAQPCTVGRGLLRTSDRPGNPACIRPSILAWAPIFASANRLCR